MTLHRLWSRHHITSPFTCECSHPIHNHRFGRESPRSWRCCMTGDDNSHFTREWHHLDSQKLGDKAFHLIQGDKQLMWNVNRLSWRNPVSGSPSLLLAYTSCGNEILAKHIFTYSSNIIPGFRSASAALRLVSRRHYKSGLTTNIQIYRPLRCLQWLWIKSRYSFAHHILYCNMKGIRHVAKGNVAPW